MPTSLMCAPLAWRSGCSVKPAVPPGRPGKGTLCVQAAAAAAERRAADEVCCATRMGVDEDHTIVIDDRAEELGRQVQAAGEADSDSEVVILDDDSQPPQHEPAAHAAQAHIQVTALSAKARGKASAPPAWDTNTAQQTGSGCHAADTDNYPTVHQEPLQAVQSSACDCPHDDDILDLTND